MKKIRELRKQLGITQTELAQKMATTTSNVSGWELGKWQPSNDDLMRLAQIFNVSVDYLLGRESITQEEREAGAAETRRISITPAEDEMLYLFREIGEKHGKSAQQSLIDMARSLLKI